MQPQRIGLKLFTREPVGQEALAPYIGVFHRFIQQDALPGLLIDVADYAHVPDGPGVILIGHDVDYGIDRTGGRTGLLTTRKRAGDRDAVELFRDTLAMALATARALEADESVSLEFAFEEVQIAFPDRMAAPNTAEAAELTLKEFEPVLHGLFGDTARVEHESAADPRRMLTLRLTGGDVDLAGLVARLEQS